MPKKKKYPRLPNRFGSIRFLGKGRSLPYAVHPPAELDVSGHYIRPAAICYVPDWYTGFAVLSSYHAGTYTPGLELKIKQEVEQCNYDLDQFCRRVIRDSNLATRSDLKHGPTLKEAFEAFKAWKFGENAVKKYSASAEKAYSTGFNWLKPLHDAPIEDITVEQLQQCVNDCPKKKATRENIVLAAKAIYKYAVPRHLCTDNPAQYIVVPGGREDESGRPFSADEIKILWKNRTDPTAEMLLIMCYSGFRLSAYASMVVNLEEGYFQGGVKTKSGKNRIVPIHPAIMPLVEARMKRYGCMLTTTNQAFRNDVHDILKRLGISGSPKHTPHDCRHTFSALCEKYKVNEADRKRMMGHSFGSDITNGIYGHRTVDELRDEIIKIPSPPNL